MTSLSAYISCLTSPGIKGPSPRSRKQGDRTENRTQEDRTENGTQGDRTENRTQGGGRTEHRTKGMSPETCCLQHVTCDIFLPACHQGNVAWDMLHGACLLRSDINTCTHACMQACKHASMHACTHNHACTHTQSHCVRGQ